MIELEVDDALSSAAQRASKDTKIDTRKKLDTARCTAQHVDRGAQL